MYESSAKRYGVPPEILDALIQQESGGNPLAVGDKGNSFGLGQFNVRGALADMGLTGEQVLAMPREQQADLTAKFLSEKIRQAGGDVWAGVKRYNGNGDPNYIVNVQRHMTNPPDVRMAGGDPSQMVPGDPRSGRMYPQATQLPPFIVAGQQPQQDSLADTLKPIIGLLAGYAGASGSPQRRIGSAGLASGAMQVAENELLDLKQRRADAMRRRQGQDSIDRYAAMLSANPETADIGAAMMVDPGAGMQMYAQRQRAQMEATRAEALAQQYETATGDTAGGARMRAGFSPGEQRPTAEYGALIPVQSPDGKTTQWWRNNRWGQPEQVEGITGSPPSQTPPLQRELKQEGATGETIGKATGASIAEMPETLATLDNNIKVIDDLIVHPGREYATGTSSLVPRMAGYAPKDYELKIGQVKGAAFLQAFESLKGGGQITEIEGQKATQAITDLDLAQSEAEHLKALNTLKEVMLKARSRALQKAGRQPPVVQEGGPAQPPAQSQPMPLGVTIKRIGD